MTLRGIPTPPGRGSGPNRTNNQPEIVTSSVSKTVDLTDYGLISSLQTQLAQAQADLAQAQAALSAAQAQIAADAITIAALQAQVASLTAQVASLQAQIAALQNPLFERYIMATITEVGGGIYVPPSYNDETISVFSIIPKTIIKTITTVGGGYP
jgi:hypothetical protein